jgi:hypothetical protein
MTIRGVYAALFGGALALVALCYGILRGSVEGWHLFLSLVPPLIIFIWWMIDRAALERRIRRLEACSEIADERRVSAQSNLTDVEHRVFEIEGRVGEVENLTTPANEAQGKLTAHKTANGKGHIPLGCVDNAINVHLPANSQ